jgi:hypothetical protein
MIFKHLAENKILFPAKCSTLLMFWLKIKTLHLQVFIEKTGTKKTIFITLISTFGAKQNEYYLQSIQNQFSMNILFEPL